MLASRLKPTKHPEIDIKTTSNIPFDDTPNPKLCVRINLSHPSHQWRKMKINKIIHIQTLCVGEKRGWMLKKFVFASISLHQAVNIDIGIPVIKNSTLKEHPNRGEGNFAFREIRIRNSRHCRNVIAWHSTLHSKAFKCIQIAIQSNLLCVPLVDLFH